MLLSGAVLSPKQMREEIGAAEGTSECLGWGRSRPRRKDSNWADVRGRGDTKDRDGVEVAVFSKCGG